ncbi:uncharacterized protein BXZ73DRAFT_78053 [Epithele typhae]|uniref:uncharacterized protein n=1 Tax=Epithele typhae TaxID=378194 RepID=UPI002008E4D4|nr:uncharacterized protein BXZ73DRAFT_78053 [Epithele typhae]KAH9929948.1 hypothetical protein BXZ73DRAFT_78053 [Epithele typhae]
MGDAGGTQGTQGTRMRWAMRGRDVGNADEIGEVGDTGQTGDRASGPGEVGNAARATRTGRGQGEGLTEDDDVGAGRADEGDAVGRDAAEVGEGNTGRGGRGDAGEVVGNTGAGEMKRAMARVVWGAGRQGLQAQGRGTALDTTRGAEGAGESTHRGRLGSRGLTATPQNGRAREHDDAAWTGERATRGTWGTWAMRARARATREVRETCGAEADTEVVVGDRARARGKAGGWQGSEAESVRWTSAMRTRETGTSVSASARQARTRGEQRGWDSPEKIGATGAHRDPIAQLMGLRMAARAHAMTQCGGRVEGKRRRSEEEEGQWRASDARDAAFDSEHCPIGTDSRMQTPDAGAKSARNIVSLESCFKRLVDYLQFVSCHILALLIWSRWEPEPERAGAARLMIPGSRLRIITALPAKSPPLSTSPRPASPELGRARVCLLPSSRVSPAALTSPSAALPPAPSPPVPVLAVPDTTLAWSLASQVNGSRMAGYAKGNAFWGVRILNTSGLQKERRETEGRGRQGAGTASSLSGTASTGTGGEGAGGSAALGDVRAAGDTRDDGSRQTRARPSSGLAGRGLVERGGDLCIWGKRAVSLQGNWPQYS